MGRRRRRAGLHAVRRPADRRRRNPAECPPPARIPAAREHHVPRHALLRYTMIDKMVSAFTLLAAPTFMVLSILAHKWLFCTALALWWWVSRSLKLLPHLRRRPSSFFLIPPFVLLSFAMAFVKIAAL